MRNHWGRVKCEARTWEESERRREEERGSEKRKSEKKEDAAARQGGKVAIHCVCPTICGSGGSKSRLAKAAGAEPSGQMRDLKLHAVAWSTFASKKCTKHGTIGPLLEAALLKKFTPLWHEAHLQVNMHKKVHSVVARSTMKQLQAPHVRTLLEVDRSKKCTPSWREALLEVKMHQKSTTCRTTFGSWHVQKLHAVVAPSTFPSQNV